MTLYIFRRILYMIPTLFIISVVSYIIIELPPGDEVTNYVAQMESQGKMVDESIIVAMRYQYGIDRPLYIQYLQWIGQVIKGNFGYSFFWNKPVNQLIGQRILFTFILSLASMILCWIISFPVGVYSATHQYTLLDYSATILGFIGISIPGFMLALILMWMSYAVFGQNIGGLFSENMVYAKWNIAKVIDFLKHLWIPIFMVAFAGTASLIRILRANLLDELEKPYVTAARTKGLKEVNLILKYPVRVSINPFISTIGWMLPELVSGSTIISVVMNLPTSGPLLLQALKTQDMHLAGSIILILSSLTVIGTLISDIALAILDPRIRYLKNNK